MPAPPPYLQNHTFHIILQKEQSKGRDPPTRFVGVVPFFPTEGSMLASEYPTSKQMPIPPPYLQNRTFPIILQKEQSRRSSH